MINIDGSYGEGGGQILRNAVALSVLIKKPVEITNIRANRPNPGIKPQHYTALKIIGELCKGKIDGLEIGSSKIIFSPGEIKGGDYSFNIGTAGSIVLVFQACILCSIKTKEKILIRLKGGTDVKWSPSWDYFEKVFLSLIQKMGIKINVKLIRRGYYPKGGGEAILAIQPIEKIQPIILDQPQNFTEVKGIIHISNLPEYVGKRMKYAAIKTMIKNKLNTSIKIEETTSLSSGTGITLWTIKNNIILGKTGLGEKGVPAEKIGESVAKSLINEINSEATIDINAFDQIVPYMALSKSKKSICKVQELSGHAQTNMWLVNQFFNNKDVYKVKTKKNLIKIEADGLNNY